MANKNLIKYREEYGRKRLDREKMLQDPIEQFRHWFKEAELAGVTEPNTMTLATVNKQGQPTIRVMLMKEITNQGLVFYTNFKSRKGNEIEKHPKVALNFYWQDLERQVRFDGTVSKIPDEQSTQYFQTRPRGSQLGAWVSQQSEDISSREYLEEQLKVCESQFKDQDIPRPPHWGGYHLIPTRVEFWQGGPHRLHDRIQYSLSNEQWDLRRLAP